jgi:ribosome biogenesis GTPase
MSRVPPKFLTQQRFFRLLRDTLEVFAYACLLKGASCASKTTLSGYSRISVSRWSKQVILENLGANEQVRRLFDLHAAQGLELGRVCFASHEQYSVYLESGLCEAVPSGRLRWDELLPAVGDWVAARLVDQAFTLIEDVLPRRTQFSRAAAGTGVREQVIAANIDLAIIVCGLDHDFNLRRIERYLVLARHSKADVLIALNKSDLCADPEEKLSQVRAIAGSASVLALSARQDVAALKAFVLGKTVALLGSSGAGKSTIANALLGQPLQATREVRPHDSRGRHTTTSRMLSPLPGGGALIDNPGMRELQMWAGESALDDVFSEIAGLAEGCKFADCTHASEPACAVKAALDSGALDRGRWESYLKLQREVGYQARQQDVHALLAQKKKWKAIHKAMRHYSKDRR